MNKPFVSIAIVAFVLLAAGCAGRPELPARSAANPVGIDLSGLWVLRGGDNKPTARMGGRDQGIRVPPPSGARNSQQRPGRVAKGDRSKNPSVHVFIENGSLLKITQTAHGLFISFDRAVVEEFTFGENRLVSLGPIEAQRVSGWEGPVLIVETMDDKGATLTETWTLGGEGSELVREIGIVDGEKQLYLSTQVFDRT